ncbi:MAG: Ig-like domain-containing protein, partial [Actinomycetota bacterium]
MTRNASAGGMKGHVMKVRGFNNQHRRFASSGSVRRVAAVLGAIGLALAPLGLVPMSAQGYQIPTAAIPWTGTAPAGTTATGTLPGGTTLKVDVTGLTTVNNVAFNPSSSYAASSAMFSPGITTTNPTVQLLTNAGSCPVTGVCASRGTATLTFSRPVRNPVLHVAGLGGANSTGPTGLPPTDSSAIHTRATLASSVPAGATFGTASSGSTNLKVTSNTFETTNSSNGVGCASTAAGAITMAATAGCGSIPVDGTVTQLTLNLDIIAQVVLGAGFGGTATSGDGWSLTFTADEDYGDAPAGYEAGAPAAHVIGSLTLGSSVDRENSTTPNTGTQAGGLSVVSGANANSPAGDGIDDNGIVSFPPLTTDLIGSTYTVPVTITGATAAAKACGWIDFDRNGSWSTTERACATVPAGATSVNLTWTIPGGTAGRTYARVRVSHDTAQVESPTGLADSGEVEDYTLEMKPVVRVNKTLIPATDPGVFDLQINGTTYASGVSDGGATGYKSLYNSSGISAPDVTVTQDVQTQAVPFTVGELAGVGINLSDYTAATVCRDANNTVLSTLAIPQSSSASGGNGKAQTITCTITNATKIDAVNDTDTTPEDTNITVNPLTNDDPTGGTTFDVASIKLLDPADGTYKTSVTIPGEGTYTVDPATGAVTFDPVPGFVGVATPVTYQVKDSSGQQDSATITITVTPKPPAAQLDTNITPQGVPVTTPILTNDTGGTGQTLNPATVQLKDPADGVFKPSVTIPGEGTYTVQPDGSVEFSPEPSFTGVGTALPYEVKNSAGVTVSSTLTITVTPVTPAAVDDTKTTPHDTNVTVDPLANDTAGNAGVPLDPATVVLKDPADGVFKSSVTIPGEGTYTVDPITGRVAFDPVPTFAGTATPLTYQVADANGTLTSAKITVTVTGPPAATPDTGTTPQNVNITVNPLMNDTAGSNGAAPLNPATVLLKDPVDGTFKSSVTVPGEGTYTVEPLTGLVTFDPDPTFTGSATPLPYQVADGDGLITSSTITMTVTPITPIATDDVKITPHDTNVMVPLLGNDSAGAVSAPLVPASVKLLDPADGVFKTSVTIPGEGTYTVDPATGSVTFDPLPTFAGTVTSVTYQVADTNGTPVTAEVTITVKGAPEAEPDTKATPQDINVVVDPLVNDSAGSDGGAPLDPASVKLLDPVDGVFKTSVVVSGEGTYTVDLVTGKVTFDPEPTFTGEATPVTYQVADEDGVTGESTITIT